MKAYVVGALLLIGVVAWSCQESRAWQDWAGRRDRMLVGVDSARFLRALGERDSLQQFIAERLGQANSESGAAYRLTSVSKAYRSVSDSLKGLLPTLTTTRDSLQNATGRIISLEVALDTSEAAIGRLVAARAADRLALDALVQDTILLHRSDSAGWASVDSLTNLVRSVPLRKWYIPELQVGYGAVVSDGVVRMGPSAQVGFRIPF